VRNECTSHRVTSLSLSSISREIGGRHAGYWLAIWWPLPNPPFFLGTDQGILRAATNAQERAARFEKQGPRHCLEVWSCLPLWRKFSRRLHGWQNTVWQAIESRSARALRRTRKKARSRVPAAAAPEPADAPRQRALAALKANPGVSLTR